MTQLQIILHAISQQHMLLEPLFLTFTVCSLHMCHFHPWSAFMIFIRAICNPCISRQHLLSDQEHLLLSDFLTFADTCPLTRLLTARSYLALAAHFTYASAHAHTLLLACTYCLFLSIVRACDHLREIFPHVHAISHEFCCPFPPSYLWSSNHCLFLLLASVLAHRLHAHWCHHPLPSRILTSLVNQVRRPCRY